MAFNTAKRTDVSEYGNYSEPTSVSRSFFGKTMHIEGEVISDEDVTIEGKVNGQLKISKTLTIGKDGHVHGEITAAMVRIAGEADGVVTASEKLEISAEGKFSGNIKAEKIVVSEGAQLKGTINLEEKTPEKTDDIDPSDTTEMPAVDVPAKKKS
jgi:cytoskeletal protein CcmA (bactofilin family)